MSYSFRGLGEGASCDQLTAAAKESSRVALTMVRTYRAKGSREKTKQIAQLLRDHSTGTGESFDDMVKRWQAKAAADAAAARGPEAAARESSRVSLAMVRVSRERGSREKTRSINSLLRDRGQPGESFDAMMRRWQQKAAADAAVARPLQAAANESSRVARTMVATRDRKWSVEKDRQIAQLRRDWGQGTGESFDDMMKRWQAKAAADAEAAKACASGGGAPGGAPGAAPEGGAPGGGADPSAPGGDAAGSESGKVLGMPIWALGLGAGVLVLGVGGFLVIRAKRKKAAALSVQK